MFICELPGFVVLHLSAVFEVALVADHDHLDVLVGMAVHLVQPPRDVVERRSAGDVVHQQDNNCAAFVRGVPAVVRPDDGLEGLLAGGIPDHGLDSLTGATEDLTAELHSERGFVVPVELALSKLQKQTALADA